MGGEYGKLWKKDWRATAPLRYKTIKISSAEALLLNSAPKELVAAPGAGKAIEFVSAVLHLDYGTLDYAANGTLHVQTHTSTSVLSGVLAAAEFMHASADKIATMVPASTGIGLDINEAIELLGIGGEVTTGDSTITVVVGYRVHSYISY
jgi:hypothetical protein